MCSAGRRDFRAAVNIVEQAFSALRIFEQRRLRAGVKGQLTATAIASLDRAFLYTLAHQSPEAGVAALQVRSAAEQSV